MVVSKEALSKLQGKTVCPCKEIGLPKVGDTCYEDVPIFLRTTSSKAASINKIFPSNPNFMILQFEILERTGWGILSGPTITRISQGNTVIDVKESFSRARKEAENYLIKAEAELRREGKDPTEILGRLKLEFEADSNLREDFYTRLEAASSASAIRVEATAAPKKNFWGFVTCGGKLNVIIRVYQVYTGTPEEAANYAEKYRQELLAITQNPELLRECTLEAVVDTYVRADYDVRKNDNYGRDRCMVIGTNRSSSLGAYGIADAMRSLVRFDTSNIVGSIKKATLELTVHSINSPTDFPFTVGVYRIVQPWVEGNGAEGYRDIVPGAVDPDTATGVAWEQIDANNEGQPTTELSPVAVVQISPGSTKAGANFSWDITSIAREWITNPASNFGVMLKDVTSDGHFRELRFGTREGDTYNYSDRVKGPRLIIQQ